MPGGAVVSRDELAAALLPGCVQAMLFAGGQVPRIVEQAPPLAVQLADGLVAALDAATIAPAEPPTVADDVVDRALEAWDDVFDGDNTREAMRAAVAAAHFVTAGAIAERDKANRRAEAIAMDKREQLEELRGELARVAGERRQAETLRDHYHAVYAQALGDLERERTARREALEREARFSRIADGALAEAEKCNAERHAALDARDQAREYDTALEAKLDQARETAAGLQRSLDVATRSAEEARRANGALREELAKLRNPARIDARAQANSGGARPERATPEPLELPLAQEIARDVERYAPEGSPLARLLARLVGGQSMRGGLYLGPVTVESMRYRVAKIEADPCNGRSVQLRAGGYTGRD
jgi:hypothetical protein